MTADCIRGCWSYLPDCVNGFSLSVWLNYAVYPTQCEDYGIVSSLHSEEAGGFFFVTWTCGSTKMGFGIVDHIDGKYKNIEKVAPPLNTWTHYVFTVDYVHGNDPIMNMYQDGTLQSVSVQYWDGGDKPASDNPRNILIFGNRFVNDEYKHNSIDIDDVLLFDYSLDQSHVTLLFNA